MHHPGLGLRWHLQPAGRGPGQGEQTGPRSSPPFSGCHTRRLSAMHCSSGARGLWPCWQGLLCHPARSESAAGHSGEFPSRHPDGAVENAAHLRGPAVVCWWRGVCKFTWSAAAKFTWSAPSKNERADGGVGGGGDQRLLPPGAAGRRWEADERLLPTRRSTLQVAPPAPHAPSSAWNRPWKHAGRAASPDQHHRSAGPPPRSTVAPPGRGREPGGSGMG